MRKLTQVGPIAFARRLNPSDEPLSVLRKVRRLLLRCRSLRCRSRANVGGQEGHLIEDRAARGFRLKRDRYLCIAHQVAGALGAQRSAAGILSPPDRIESVEESARLCWS